MSRSNIHSFPVGPGPRWAARLKSASQVSTAYESIFAHFFIQPPSLGYTARDKLGAWFCPASQSLGMQSLNHPQGEPVTAWEFLIMLLQAILNKCRAFHTAQLSNQSRDYPSQGLTQPNSSLLQMTPGTSISLVPVSTVPVDVYHLCVTPTSSLFPPATYSI